MLKIAIISDIHHGPERGTKKGTAAKQLVSSFLEWTSKNQISLIADLGDRISEVSQQTDEEHIQEVASWFKETSIPQVHLPGNHDLQRVSLERNQELLGFLQHSQSFDLQGFHLIFWNSGVNLSHERGFSLNMQELNWLKDDLVQATLPTLIFSHLPLDNGSMKGNFYFDKAYPHHAYYKESEGEMIREVLEKSGKVVLCVNGHAHWNAYHCIDGVHYLTVPSLTEIFPTYPRICESWAELSLGEEIHFKVYGNLPVEYRLPLKTPTTEHWLNIHKSYAPQIAKPF